MLATNLHKLKIEKKYLVLDSFDVLVNLNFHEHVHQNNTYIAYSLDGTPSRCRTGLTPSCRLPSFASCSPATSCFKN